MNERKWYTIGVTYTKKTKETFMENIEKMARIEREIEKRMEAACEKDGWVASVAMYPINAASLIIEKINELPVTAEDAEAAMQRALQFAKDEFGTEASVERDDELIPNTRAPYHVRFHLKVDGTSRVAELAA